MKRTAPAWQVVPNIELDFAGPSWREVYGGFESSHCTQGRELLAAVLGPLPDGLELMVQLAHRNTEGRFLEEANVAGEALGVAPERIMLAAISYDLMMMAFGCSTLALAGPEGPLLVRNLDWWPEAELARHCYNICHRRQPSVGATTHSAGWPGFLGVVTGMSERGFALAMNAVQSPEPSAPTGYPMLLLLRRVLEDARDFSEAMEMVQTIPVASDALVTLVGPTNDQRVVIERSPSQAGVRKAQGDMPLVTTNDYLQLYTADSPEGLSGPSAELYGSSCDRRQRLLELVPKGVLGRDIDKSQLLSWLSDEGVIQSITAQHVIACPAQGCFDVFVPRRLL